MITLYNELEIPGYLFHGKPSFLKVRWDISTMAYVSKRQSKKPLMTLSTHEALHMYGPIRFSGMVDKSDPTLRATRAIHVVQHGAH